MGILYIPARGLMQLVDATKKLIPKAATAQNAFASAQQVDIRNGKKLSFVFQDVCAKVYKVQ